MGGQIHRRLLCLTVLTATAVAPCFAWGQSAATEKGPASAPKPVGLGIFTAGHSLHWYVPGIVAELASSYGVKDHKQVGVQSIGVSRTIQHWNHRGGRNQARQALEKGNVDVLTMSPIQFPDEGIDNFVKLGLGHNPNMKFAVQLSWGGPDIDNQDFSMKALGQGPTGRRPRTN